MGIKTTTHLNFQGTARQALDFYRAIFGGDVNVATYGDFGMPQGTPGADKVLFGQLENSEGFRLMAYDIPGQEFPVTSSAGNTHRVNGTTITDRAFFQSVRTSSLEELTDYWHRLAEDAVIVEPLASSAWTAGFGMLTDKFGVTWVLDVEPARAG